MTTVTPSKVCLIHYPHSVDHISAKTPAINKIWSRTMKYKPAVYGMLKFWFISSHQDKPLVWRRSLFWIEISHMVPDTLLHTHLSCLFCRCWPQTSNRPYSTTQMYRGDHKKPRHKSKSSSVHFVQNFQSTECSDMLDSHPRLLRSSVRMRTWEKSWCRVIYEDKLQRKGVRHDSMDEFLDCF